MRKLLIGLITRNPNSWSSYNLIRAIEDAGHKVMPFQFNDLIAFIDYDGVKIKVGDVDLMRDASAIIVRPFGRMSLDQAIFRIDLLYALNDSGIPIFNKPYAIERCVDKFRALCTLKMHGIPVPKTIVTEKPNTAFKNLEFLKSRKIVLKPMFGSKGHGSTRINIDERDVLWEVLHTIGFAKHTIYMQEYLKHGGRDIRAFVLGNRILAAMYRKAPKGMWKTNIAQGAIPKRIEKLEPELEEIALKSTEILGCEIAGIDMVIVGESPYVLEVNSQPGWKGLQSVVTDMDIAMEIAKYVIEKAKK